MEAEIKRLLDTFGDLRKEANVNACFGDPVTVGSRTVIPFAKVGYGFGIGAGPGPTVEAQEGTEEIEKKATGGGGGITSSPLGFVEITPQGTRVEPIIDEQKVAVVAMLVAAWSVFWFARALMAIFGGKDEG
jgi:uncharacterized spore protein YtfJ